MNYIRDIITTANIYLQKTKNPSPDALTKVAKYVTKMMRTFGVFRDANPEIGESSGAAGTGLNVEDVAGPYVRLLSAFRDKVRELSRSKAGEFLIRSNEKGVTTFNIYA
jgi:cysteinyl-tRNA synthetase